MVTPPLAMHTERLDMRKPSPADAAEIFRAYAQDPEVTRYLSWSPARGVGDVEAYLRKALAGWEGGTSFAWCIMLRETGELIGMAEARVDAYMVNLGYLIARPFWHRGFATEAVRALCAWADREPEIFRVWAVCAADNPASARVLEKAGMVCEGLLRRWAVLPNVGGTPRDCFCYARVREA